MSDNTSASQEPIEPIHQPRHKRRAMGVVGALVVLVGLCVMGYEVVAHSRYKVVGKTDPITGYHIEYTVSSRYRKTAGEKDMEGNRAMDSWHYSLLQIPRPVQWINEHIFRIPARNPRPLAYGWEIETIYQSSLHGEVKSIFRNDAPGFLNLAFMRRFYANVVQKHALVSGSPSLWCAYTFPGSGGLNQRIYRLFVQSSDQHMVYEFSASDDSANPTGIEDEMLKIRDSLRIIKAK